MSQMTLREAREAYFRAGGIPADGGYDEAWVPIRIGPVRWRYRNSEGRKRLAPVHDLHHVVTGYGTDLLGESEIAAWELGSGLRDRTGIWLSLRVLGFMGLRAPRRSFRAFLRGRASRNLFDQPDVEPLLDQRVDELRAELEIPDEPPTSTAADRVSFAGWVTAGVVIIFGPLVPLGVLLWWWLG